MKKINRMVYWISFSLLSAGAGVILGLAVSTHFNWTPVGRAVTEEKRGAFDRGFADISKAATPAVVNIATTRLVRNQGGPNPFFEDPLFRPFFGEEFGKPFQQPGARKEQSLGSGVIVDPDGIIITNNHVVANADEIKVFLSDKREFKGKVIGTDPKTDLAVVKINGNRLPFIPWGKSTGLEVGEYVLAIGNPFGLNQTVTMGIISALGRANVGISDYEDFIQTDAAINPGNSGGALIDTSGKLIGINTAIFSKSGGYMGIGFAIPSDMARSVTVSILKGGKVVRGWLGVMTQEVTPSLAKTFGLKESSGALVSEVMEKSPAEKGGVIRGDVIIQFQGKPVENPLQLRNAVLESPVGTKVRLVVFRDRKEVPVELGIEEQPAERVAKR
jgi:serine protease Do